MPRGTDVDTREGPEGDGARVDDEGCAEARKKDIGSSVDALIERVHKKKGRFTLEIFAPEDPPEAETHEVEHVGRGRWTKLERGLDLLMVLLVGPMGIGLVLIPILGWIFTLLLFHMVARRMGLRYGLRSSGGILLAGFWMMEILVITGMAMDNLGFQLRFVTIIDYLIGSVILSLLILSTMTGTRSGTGGYVPVMTRG